MTLKQSISILLLCGSSTWATTYYVSPTGKNISPYTTPELAATHIQDAIDEASAGDTVLVDPGVYDRGYTITPDHILRNRVVITKDIQVLATSSDRSATVISGITSGLPIDPTEVRCVYMTTGLLRGFTLRDGHANNTSSSASPQYDQSGGGVFARWGGEVENCVITNCIATDAGGGSYYGTLQGCTFSGNSATNRGGGAFQGTLTGCTLENNSAHNGGGLANSTAIRCQILNNHAYNGGGSYLGTLSTCTISINTADYGGGGAYGGTAEDCIFKQNHATASGGGCSSTTLSRCVVENNTTSVYGGGCYRLTGSYCTLANNTAKYGGGCYDTTLSHSELMGNSASNYGGGCSLSSLSDCNLMDNTATTAGGGSYNSALTRCILTGNSSDNFGGGAYGAPSTDFGMTNCVLTFNRATYGGGVYGYTINHCTIKANHATSAGGGSAGSVVLNSIVVQNTTDNTNPNLQGSSLSSITNSCSPDLSLPLNNCITNAPLFADASLHLRVDSPCVDAAASGSTDSDLDGVYRPLDGDVDFTALPDMGAFEAASDLIDMDSDGLTDWEELHTYHSDPTDYDTDDDGRSDYEDIAAGFSPTFNENPAIAQGENNVSSDPSAYDLYTSDSIQDLNMGHLMLQVSNSTMNLSLKMQQSATPGSNDWIEVGVPAEWSIPSDSDTSFFRVQAE